MCCVGSFAFSQSEGLPPTAAGGMGGKDQLLFICIFGASCCPRPPPFPQDPRRRGSRRKKYRPLQYQARMDEQVKANSVGESFSVSLCSPAAGRRGKNLGDVATFSSSAIIVLVWKKTLHDEERGGGVIIRTSIQTLLFFHSYMQVRAKKDEKLCFCYEH